VIFSFALKVPTESILLPSRRVRDIGLNARGREQRPARQSGGRASRVFHKPGTDLALTLEKQIRVAQRPQPAQDFIGLSVNFLLGRAQPLREI
jgi:hypothetical protein